MKGDPAFPAPPKARETGRNCSWRHLYANDVISLPCKFEYNVRAGNDGRGREAS